MTERRDWSRILSIVISTLAFIMGVYHLIYSRWLLQDPLLHQNTHLTFALLLVFLTALSKKPKLWPYIFTFIILSLIGVVYVHINFVELTDRAGIPISMDIVFGTIITLVVLEACRQTFGWVIPAIAVFLMAYALASSYLPPPFFHTEISYAKVISWSSIAFNGVYGMFLHQSATYMIFFVLFCAFRRPAAGNRCIRILYGTWKSSRNKVQERTGPDGGHLQRSNRNGHGSGCS